MKQHSYQLRIAKQNKNKMKKWQIFRDQIENDAFCFEKSRAIY